MDTYVVKRLEQAKLLTDPFKLKLLERFARHPATTKQVADRMGEKAPRLYRHVDALVEEGLLELVRENPKRGTIERYYRTVADRFEVDPNLFSAASSEADDALEMVRSMFRDTESELIRFFDGRDGEAVGEAEMPLIMKVGIRGTAEEIARLRLKLDEWLDECNAMDNGSEDLDNLEAYTGFLAFFKRPDGN